MKEEDTNTNQPDELNTTPESTPSILIVGAGGIGSNLVDLIVPALSRCGIKADLHLMDDDMVDAGNIGHQRFDRADIGTPKVDALASRHTSQADQADQALRVKQAVVGITSHSVLLRSAEQLEDHDIIIIAVDRPEPRRLAHQSGKQWLDLRCQGDGFMLLDHNTEAEVVQALSPEHQPTSCQIPGAIEAGNIEFGYAAVAALGAQWLFQSLRILAGHTTCTPKAQMGSLSFGELPMPSLKISEVAA